MAQVWNLPTIGSGLPAVAAMLREKQQDEIRQQALIAENARRDQQFGLDQMQFGLMQQKFNLEKTTAEENKHYREKLSEMEQYSGSPESRKAYIEKQRKEVPEFANTPFATMAPDEAFSGMYRGLQIKAGEKADKVKGPISAQAVPGYGTVVVQDNEALYGRPTPAPNAPNRDVELWKFRESLPPDKQKEFDSVFGSRSGADTGFSSSDSNAIRGIVVNTFGGDYDPMTGRVTGLDKDTANRALQVEALAGQIFAANPRMPHAVAVQEAFKQLNGPAAGPSAPAAPVAPRSAGGPGRLRFDAQGNPIR